MPMHYVLQYDVAPDYAERRIPLRAEHLAHAQAAVDRGELLLGGAFDTMDGALLLFVGESDAAARAFPAGDPYVREGVVTAWRVRGWTTVVGKDAVAPVSLPPR